MLTLEDQINAVVEARRKFQEMADKKESLYEEFRGKHWEFFGDVATAASRAGEAEEKLRELALQAYAETGNKAPAPGVGIRERTVLTYDTAEAFNWALEHRIALQLNKTAFDKLAKTAPETRPAFVMVTTEPQATIATQLEGL
ncbi:hypothetical protein ES708_27396 [subsurface metagenome]